jgi:hypothetical protein
MTFEERKGDLFSVGLEYYLCHCISADYRMGAGIAVEMEKRFKIRDQLKKEYGSELMYPDCVRTGRVYNLVTKRLYYNKPTYYTLRSSLEIMRGSEILQTGELVKIAMPRIGCGLDKLDWELVKTIIQDVFKDSDVEIIVYSR